MSKSKYIEINKPLIGQLFASGLYCHEDKFILEVIAPGEIIRKHSEHDDSDRSIGEQWEMGLKEMAKSQWPLENANYYLEVNGVAVGEDAGSSTRFRYEPEREPKEERHNIISESKPDEDSFEIEPLRPAEKGLSFQDESEQKKSITNLFEDKDFQSILASLLESLPPVDPDNPDAIKAYLDQKEKEEELFFREFRTRHFVPDYLQNRSIVLAECFFRGRDLLSLFNEIESIKFVLKSTTKHLLIRKRYVLPFGECFIQVKSDEWSTYAEKIWLEDIVEVTGAEGKSDNVPAGKKAVYIRYETVDNVLAQPLFYTTETLLSNHLSYGFVFDNTKRLEGKGKKGFNQYITFAGYIDEQADKADFELFQMVVTFEHNQRYVLI